VSIAKVMAILAGLFKACLIMPVAEALGSISLIWANKATDKKPKQALAIEKASRGALGAMALLGTTRGLKASQRASIRSLLNAIQDN
jgi:hypothetical protein